MSTQRTDNQRLIDVIDALNKLKSLLDAALHLSANDAEKETRLELISIAGDVVIRTLGVIE